MIVILIMIVLHYYREGGTLISYGNASRRPVHLPTGLFVEKGISYLPFNLASYVSQQKPEDLKEHVTTLVELVEKEQLHVWLKTYDMWDFSSAFNEVMFPKQRKLIFSLHKDGHFQI